MRRILGTIFLVIAAASVAAGQANAEAARAEINAGASEYREGNFAAAEEHFRRALELDPTQKNTQLFIARAVQQQFKPGDTTPENVAVGERAVARGKADGEDTTRFEKRLADIKAGKM